jgi:hypothetical protein
MSTKKPLQYTLTGMFAYLVLIVAMPSCDKEVDWEFPSHPPKPTISGIVEAGKPVWVHISLSGSIDSAQLTDVTNAQVNLYENGYLLETLEHTSNGLYTSSSEAQQGNEYKCEVSVPGYELVSATTIVPLAAPIENVKFIKNAWFNYWGDLQNAVEVTFSKHDASYLEVVVWSDSERRVTPANIDDPVLLSEGLDLTLFSTKFVPTDTYTMRINLQIEDDTPIVVELRSVCKHYYSYQKQLSLYGDALYPDFFTGALPAIPLYSNVKGGYGIFAGYSKAISDTITPQLNAAKPL